MLTKIFFWRRKKKIKKRLQGKKKSMLSKTAIQNSVAEARHKHVVTLLIKAADGTFEPNPITQTLGTVLQTATLGKVRSRRQTASVHLLSWTQLSPDKRTFPFNDSSSVSHGYYSSTLDRF